MSVSTLLIIGGATVMLVLVALAALVLRDPGAAQRRVESVFRRPETPPKTAGNEQYYRPYWSR
jgi:Na+-transporting methylmalonyl-CoA/oxaloacetate decarboxylase gamma subunit